MIPIAILYNIPEDAANEIAFLYKRKYPISWIEMGEEADGQRVLPEDYATLYCQFSAAIHKLVPQAPLGGPAFEGTSGDVDSWPDGTGKVSFLGRFVDYLKAHGHLKDFTFFSFEHYPCQGNAACRNWETLYDEPYNVNRVVQAWKDNGLPPNVPFFMTEGNDLGDGSATEGKTGLWLADYVGSMMTAGAGGTYYFHYIASVGRGGGGGGGGFLAMDQNGKVTNYPPQYLATQVITKEWVQPVDAPHKLFKVESGVKDKDGHVLVTAYAVQRPDGQWSIMFVNKDHDSDHSVKVAFADPLTKHDRYFSGKVDRVVLGQAEYVWHADPAPSEQAAPPAPAAGAAAAGGGGGRGGRGGRGSGHADPDGPPSKSTLTAAGPGTLYQLPRASIVVLRGQIAEQ
jgi:hypothetical protein